MQGEGTVNIVSIRVFDRRLSVFSEDDNLIAHIRTYAKGMIDDTTQDEASVRLFIFQAPGNRILMCCPELGTVADCRTPTCAYVIYRRIIRAIMTVEDRRSFLLHGCCVSKKGSQAILLIGAGSAGKTSLTGALLQRGLLFACDDYTYITDLGYVNVFPVASAISPNTFDLIPELRRLRRSQCKFRASQGWEWTAFYGDIFPYVPAYTKLPVSHVFFLTPNFGKESSVVEMHNSDVQCRLYEAKHSTPLPHEVGESSQREREARAVTSLMKTARFFEARNGNIQDLADIIYGVVNG